MAISQETDRELSRTARLPFYFGQSVTHGQHPDVEFRVVGMTLGADHHWSVTVVTKDEHYRMFPSGELRGDFAPEKIRLARWMGCSVETMEMDHDRLHDLLADMLGMSSFARKIANGKRLNEEEAALASLEDNAVLHLQKYIISRVRSERHSASQAR